MERKSTQLWAQENEALNRAIQEERKAKEDALTEREQTLKQVSVEKTLLQKKADEELRRQEAEREAEEEARKAEEAQEALAKAAAAEAAKNKPTSPRAKPPPRRAAGGAAAKPVVASKSRKRARDDDDAPAARPTKPRLKKVKIERTGPLRRSTREGIKKKKGFYSQRAMELEAWKGTGTKDDPYDAR